MLPDALDEKAREIREQVLSDAIGWPPTEIQRAVTDAILRDRLAKAGVNAAVTTRYLRHESGSIGIVADITEATEIA